ncbi:MAG TPA: hypothetical protein DCX06_07055 [Opitutae bacterium]|nr:hypothetical protein [Opitutae bacterium]
MKFTQYHFSLGLVAGALFFTACGKSDESATADSGAAEASAELVIPDAPDEAMQLIFSELAKGNGGIVWQAMPASYQSDVNTIVQLAGTKIDAEMYDTTIALLGRIGQVADKQQAFIVNSQFTKSSPEQKAKLEQALPSMLQLFEVVTTSDLATSAGLQSFDGQKFFDTTVSDLAKLSIELSKLEDSEQLTLEDLGQAEFSTVELSDLAATLKVAAGGQEQTEMLTKVEDRWVPADLAADWSTNMAQGIAQLEAISPEQMTASKPQMMTVIAMLDGVLTQIESAKTQEAFDESLQGAMMPLMGMMMMGQGMGGAAPAMPAPAMPTAP